VDLSARGVEGAATRRSGGGERASGERASDESRGERGDDFVISGAHRDARMGR
jgi:hypothetical protein